MANRSYTTKTIKILFGSSGNQCAHPECVNPVIAPGSDASDDAVLGQICHIYAASDNGPRGNPDLTDEERNSPDNLILLCGFHHPMVDTQHQDYPAELLKQWKRNHEVNFQPDTAEAIRRQDQVQRSAFTVQLTDQQINAEVRRLRQARHLVGYSSVDKARALAASVEGIEFAGGSSALRAQALAWCARILARGEDLPRAKALLAKSRDLGGSTESGIANAFIMAAETGGTASALLLLAQIGTPESRSAMLRLVSNEKGPDGALDWARSAGLHLGSFDSDGKLNFIMSEEFSGRWSDAYADVQKLTSTDFEETPVLNYAAAQAHLSNVVPEELRTQAMFQLPFNASRVPLADDGQARYDRARAIQFYEKQAAVAEEFGAVEAARLSFEMALWLRLRDAELYDEALEVLRNSMRDDALMLRRFPMAVDFGLNVDLDAVERRVNERVALTGKGTVDEAVARLALAMTKEAPAAIEYIALHRNQLTEFLAGSSLLRIEIELLCRSGQPETAKSTLGKKSLANLGERERERLQRVIAEAEGADPAAERRKLYEATGDLRDLANLVSFLEQERAWQDLCPLAEALFAKTRSVEDALRVTRAFGGAGEHRRILEFLKAIPDIVSRENELQSLLAWALYRDGQFNEASEVLASLRAKRDDINDRALFVNLAIASGQWDTLAGYTTREYEQKGQRTAEELLRAGQLAQAVNAPQAKALIVAATEVAPGDPHILAPAYFHAASAGWENDLVVRDWLPRAAETSGEQGPLKSMTMKDLSELKPDWDRRRDEIYNALLGGQITISVAAHALNQSMIHNCLLRPASNRTETDARRRSLVFAFSGARPSTIQCEPKRVALDLTAIFTFAQLGLLPKLLAHFERVLVPDQLLVWLFQERQRVAFHQPSRIRDAQFLKRLLADGSLKIFASKKPASLHLVHEVGFDLASMLEAAAESSAEAYVIRSSPIHRLGSVMGEEADVAKYESHLCSCQAVVEALRLKGMVTAAEEQRALSYLKLHERRWPSEPRIRDGAILYLDDLSTTYLRTSEVLGKLKGAGFAAYVTKSLDDQDNQLLAYESFTGEQLATIESIREVFACALADGRVDTIASPDRDSEDTPPIAQLNFLVTDKPIDAFVVDDRFVNRYLHMTRGEGQTPIFTSLDLVEHLAASGSLSIDEAREHRTTLRRSGYTFVPVLNDELMCHLLQAPIEGGELIETAELRALREAAQRLRMEKVLQVPHELTWLNQFTLTLVQAVREVWNTESNPETAEARCEWLLRQLDIRGWAPNMERGAATRFSVMAYAGLLNALCFAPGNSAKQKNDGYHRWIDNRVLTEIKETEPEVFEQIVALATTLFSGRKEDDLEGGRMIDENKYLRAARAIVLANGYSPLLRGELLARSKLVDMAGVETDATISLGAEDLSFRRSQLFPAIAAAYDRVSNPVIASVDGSEWTLRFFDEAQPPNVALLRGDQRLVVLQFSLLAPEAEARLHAFRLIAEHHRLSDDLMDRWRLLLSERTPNDYEITAFVDDLQNTPVGVAEAIGERLRRGKLSFDALVPRSEAYYRQLVGDVGSATSLEDCVARVAAPFLAELFARGDQQSLSMAWPLCSHQSISQMIERKWEGDDRLLADSMALLIKQGDPVSRTGAIELGLRQVRERSALTHPLTELINAVLDGENGDDGDEFALLSALFSCIYGQMARCRVLASWPPFARRLASLAHASIVIRQVVEIVKERINFIGWLLDANEGYFFMQTLVDMRVEPRWFPELGSTEQWRNELLGRIWIAANSVPEAVEALGLTDRLIGDGPEAILRKIDRAEVLLPGPLEGGTGSQFELNPESARAIEGRLSGVVDTTTFSGLLNSSFFFRVPDRLADLAAEAIERNHYQITADERVPFSTCLIGLASVAAVTRNTKLRDAIHTVLRVSWRLNPGQLTADESFRAGILACAANGEFADWAENVGRFMTELSLQDLSEEDADALLSHLSTMCHLEPELWGTCGRAHAAFGLIVGR